MSKKKKKKKQLRDFRMWGYNLRDLYAQLFHYTDAAQVRVLLLPENRQQTVEHLWERHTPFIRMDLKQAALLAAEALGHDVLRGEHYAWTLQECKELLLEYARKHSTPDWYLMNRCRARPAEALEVRRD